MKKFTGTLNGKTYNDSEAFKADLREALTQPNVQMSYKLEDVEEDSPINYNRFHIDIAKFIDQAMESLSTDDYDKIEEFVDGLDNILDERYDEFNKALENPDFDTAKMQDIIKDKLAGLAKVIADNHKKMTLYDDLDDCYQLIYNYYKRIERQLDNDLPKVSGKYAKEQQESKTYEVVGKEDEDYKNSLEAIMTAYKKLMNNIL